MYYTYFFTQKQWFDNNTREVILKQSNVYKIIQYKYGTHSILQMDCLVFTVWFTEDLKDNVRIWMTFETIKFKDLGEKI